MKNLSLIGIPVLLVLFFAINLASGAIFTSTRIDLTDNKLFTLSDGTRSILSTMEEPVTLRYFYSSKLAKEEAPFAERPAQRVREMLDEMKAAADGRLTVLEIDPVSFSEEEDQAVEFGVRGAPATSAGDMIYMAVAGTNSVDDQEVLDLLPLVQGRRREFLEYDLAKLIYSLANPEKHRVGVLSTLPIEGSAPNPMNPRGGAAPWFFLSQLQATFEIEMIPRSATELPEDIDLLLLVHPKELDPQLLFQIDQFVLGGGKMVAFLDPHCEADQEGINPQDQMSAFSANRTSDLGPLPASWGFEMVDQKLAADRQNAHRVRLPTTGADIPYLVWLNLNAEHVEPSDPVVSELQRLHMATAGILQATADATTTFSPLIQTGTETMMVDRYRVAMRPDPENVMDNFVNEGKKLTLAARISGAISTAYPDGPPEAPVAEGEEPPAPMTPPSGGWKTEGEAQIIVIADADMLQDHWWVNISNFLGQRLANETADNSKLLINALDNLTGNTALISLRSRVGYQRPFTRVEKIRDEADERFREEEQQLQAELEEAERKIAELQTQKEGAVSSMIITPEQREEIDRFKQKRIETRKKLRDVKYSLKKDIERLGLLVKALNFLVPTLVALAGIGLWIFRTSIKSS
jgi:ABC-type uncharacterized transport system involved in gliding motility auxiliary subunit